MAESTNKWMKLIRGAVKFMPEAPWVGLVVELLSQLASAMGATSGDSKEALRHIEGLQSDISQITSSHAALISKVDEQGAKLATQVTALNLYTRALEALNDELKAAHTTEEGLRARLEKLERRTTLLGFAGLGLGLAVCVLLIVLVVHLRR
jgi:septal ring factor EnvC (AmiA/AmiB activator)